MDAGDITRASAATLAVAIRDGDASSQEVVDAHLRRIEAVNPKINAVVQLAAQTAREEAREADAALARGELQGPLHGVPFTVKDWIEAKGVVCAAGLEERRAFVPKRDATVVARMRAAGGIMLGKTNVNDGSPVYERPNNPHDLSRSPGASSSGEAAIIAVGGSALGLGSDSGGSLRLPAHCCGIATLKPTAGRVPNTGHFPRISAMNDPRTQIGPLARSVEDLALALSVITGEDWRDASVVPMPMGDPAAVDLPSLRVAFYTDDGVASPSDSTVAVVQGVAGALADVGLDVAEARPSRIEESLAITKKYWQRARSPFSTSWSPPTESDMTGDEVDQGLFEWDRLKRAMLSYMKDYDVIVCPVAEGPARPHGEASIDDFIYTLPYSLTGWPVAVVRAGTSSGGLPIGVQIVARPWRDDVALAVALHIERTTGPWPPPQP